MNIIKHLLNLCLGVTLREKLDSVSALVRRALSRFALFCTFPSKEEKGNILQGEEAYAALYEQVGVDFKKAAEVAPEDVEKLQLFLWLCQPGTEQTILDMCKKLVEKSGKPAKCAKSSASSASAPAPAAAGKAAKPDEKLAAMRYFD